ncbi:MAG: radical SAM protein [Dysgonamonadaceae bacterium]|jgi:MoaA/NifB/PqqE/SkfB family radical SAM enzyme|nr:radical SAM protein [Dysgonamonadaceae bacterium]
MKFQSLYLPLWFLKVKFFGKRQPLQSVVFISDLCNLKCRHCCVYARKTPTVKSFEQIKDDLEYCYRLGSRFVDFEGGEPTLWRDGKRDINSLVRLAKETGFFSTTITTNAVRPFDGLEADSLWISLDGIGEYHDKIRGAGAFDKLVKNIAYSGHKHLNVNMVINTVNYSSVDDTLEFVKQNPNIEAISFNFHTPYPDTEDLFLDWEIRRQIIDKLIEYKQKKYPIINSVSGLRLMKHNKFKKQCWVSNFILVDGSRLPMCDGDSKGLCDSCGFCMAGEMHSVMALKPDTLFAGMKLRM